MYPTEKDLSVQGCTEGTEGTEGCTGDLLVQGCHGALTGDIVQKSNHTLGFRRREIWGTPQRKTSH